MDRYLRAKIKMLSLFSIVAVVYIHACTLRFPWSLLPGTPILDPQGADSFVQYFVANGLTRFAVPLFFAISGYLYFLSFSPTYAGFRDKLVRRLRSIGLPYLLWSALGLLLTVALLHLPALRPACGHWAGRTLTGFQVIPALPSTGKTYLFRLLIKPVPYQLWFLRDLLLYVLCAPLIYIALRRLSWIALLPPFALWFLNRNLHVIEAEGILFFLLGAWMSIQKITPPRNPVKWLPILLGALWISVLAMKTGFAYPHGPHATSALLVTLHKIGILLGVCTVWFGYDALSGRIGTNKTLQAAAPFTFFLYAAHEPLLNLLSNSALYILGISPTTQLVVFLLGPIVTIGLCLSLGVGLRRLAPSPFALLTGGRS